MLLNREIGIRVNSSKWNVVMTDSAEELRDRNGHICKGTTSYKNRKIYLDFRVSREDLLHIIKHELTHIYIYETQIELKERYSEEDICEFVAIYGARIINKANSILKRISI